MSNASDASLLLQFWHGSDKIAPTGTIENHQRSSPRAEDISPAPAHATHNSDAVASGCPQAAALDSDALATRGWVCADETLPLRFPEFSSLRLPLSDAAPLFVRAVRFAGAMSSASEPLAFDINPKAIERLAVTILGAYRPLPYHNWRHAVNTVHCMLMFLERTSVGRNLVPLHRLAALLAALAHDVDHRGHTNAFESNSLSDLALKYNTDSVLEHHHAAIFLEMLRGTTSAYRESTDMGHIQQSALNRNVLNLSLAAFSAVRSMSVAAILATDSKLRMERHDAILVHEQVESHLIFLVLQWHVIPTLLRRCGVAGLR